MKALTLEIITMQYIRNTFQKQSEIKTVMDVPQVHVKHVSFNESRKKFEQLAICSNFPAVKQDKR